MTYYDYILNTVKSILYSDPVDIYCKQDEIVISGNTYQLSTCRENNNSSIGLVNYLMAHEWITDFCEINEITVKEDIVIGIWLNVLNQLEKDNILKKTPEEHRRNFKVITNDRSE